MQGINIREGQEISIGTRRLLLKSIDFSSIRSFITYAWLPEDGAMQEQEILYVGEQVQLMPQLALMLVMMVNREEAYAVLQFDVPHDMPINCD